MKKCFLLPVIPVRYRQLCPVLPVHPDWMRARGRLATMRNGAEKRNKRQSSSSAGRKENGMADMVIKKIWFGAELNPERIPEEKNAEAMILYRGADDPGYKFLHDCAVTAYHGRLYAAWYNCPEGEMAGSSVIRGRVSGDGGKTWDAVRTLAADPENKYMYVPPAFGVCPKTDKLYLLVSRMTGCDVMKDWEIFILDEKSGDWTKVRTLPQPFLPNTPVFRRSDGKLIIGGRVSPEPGTCPEIPAAAISDSGAIDAPWRIVRIQDMVKAPDRGNPFPETALIADGMDVTAFVRHDCGEPLMYESPDGGETWSEPVYHNIPDGASKVAAGMLSDSSRWILANLPPVSGVRRSMLALYRTEPGKKEFTRVSWLRNGIDPELDAVPEWSYPAAVEQNGYLYVMCTSAKKNAVFIKVKL